MYRSPMYKKNVAVLVEPGIHYESASISAILSFALENFKSNDIVVFDVDDVLITNRLSEYFYKDTELTSNTPHEILTLHQHETLILYLMATYSADTAKVMDEKIPQLIKELQEKGVKCIANTAQRHIFGSNHNYDAGAARIEFLRNLGFDFSNAFPDQNYELDNLHKQGSQKLPVLFKEGILFSGGVKKSIAQRELFTKLNFTPTKMLFIDDNIRNVYDVYKGMADLGVACYSFCYLKKDTKPFLQYFSIDERKKDLENIGKFVDMVKRGVKDDIDVYLKDSPNQIFIKNLNMGEGWSINLENTRESFVERLLRQSNENVDFYLRKVFLPNKYQEMQELINKYCIGIKVKDDASLRTAYHKIALSTHPDKTSNLPCSEDMKQDFIKAHNLLKQDSIVDSSVIYKHVIEKLYKANLYIKMGDTVIDVAKGLIKPTLENGLKIGIDCIQLSAMYHGNYGVMLSITGIGALYQIYHADYKDAITSIVTSAGITLMSTAVYATTPALSITLTGGFTGYAGYTMLKNAYELYYEWQDTKTINNLEHEMAPSYLEL